MATVYEQQRDARIRSNNAIMEKLGINGLVPAGLRAPKGKPMTSKAKKGKVTRDVGDEAARRHSSSSRQIRALASLRRCLLRPWGRRAATMVRSATLSPP